MLSLSQVETGLVANPKESCRAKLQNNNVLSVEFESLAEGTC